MPLDTLRHVVCEWMIKCAALLVLWLQHCQGNNEIVLLNDLHSPNSSRTQQPFPLRLRIVHLLIGYGRSHCWQTMRRRDVQHSYGCATGENLRVCSSLGLSQMSNFRVDDWRWSREVLLVAETRCFYVSEHLHAVAM